MSSRKFPIVTDEVTGKIRVRSYDIRVASQQYANIAGILAGFAFTVLILVAQESNPSLSTLEILGRNLAAVSFFVSFFGCILSAFAFALVSGEEALTPRANQMAFFAGAGFSLTISLLFWSIAVILQVFLVKEAAVISNQIFPLFVIIHPFYVLSSVLDNIYIYDCRKPRFREYLISFIPSLIPILIAFLFRVSGLTISAVLHLNVFYSIVWLFLIMIIIGNLVSAIFSATADDFRITLKLSSLWMCLHSILVSFLIILI